MKLTLTPTGTVNTIDGHQQARIWHGETDSGVRVKVWIAFIQPQTADPARLAAFEESLRQVKVERELVNFSMRMVI